MNSISKKIATAAVASFALLLLASIVAAQPQPSWAGKYAGVAKDDTGAEQKLALEIIEDAGKYTGTFTTAKGPFKILKGQMADGVLTLDIEKPGGGSGQMSFKKNGDVLVATFTEAGKTHTIDFRKAAADDISGEWDAMADANGQAFPFTLSLKVDGEKVTGSSSSQLGTASISTGTWKDGKLSFVLEGGSGQITMAATIVDGKLSGDFDFAGQMSGKWIAQKKK
jgi:hypothetical protein